MEIATNRLILRPFRPDDAIEVLPMLLDLETRRWNPVAGVVDEQSARAWCVRMADRSGIDHLTMHAGLPQTGELVGYVSVFAVDTDHATAKVGYRVAPGQRRQGYASEMLCAVTDVAFTELSLERVQLEHAVANVASCAVALSAAYRLEGTLRSSYAEPGGDRHDEHVHGRLASDRLTAR